MIECKTEIFTCKFLIPVYHFVMNNIWLKEAYFQLNIMIKEDSKPLDF